MTENLPLLPLGTSSFALLRMREQIYVDKTELVYALASKPEKFFLSRPRRFGKSLLVSTFESLFSHGLRDFRGLAIEKLWKDNGKYLVTKLDFSEIKEFTSAEKFERKLCALLASAFGRLGFCYDADKTYLDIYTQLSNWFKTLPLGSLVVLIDEYDAPLTASMGNGALFLAVRSELSSFYSLMKANDQALRFFFMTGITKFSKTSIFSEWNMLSDISLDGQYGTLLGYTHDEVERYFGDYLDRAAKVLKTDRKSLMHDLTEHYDGFCFDQKASSRVFAPWSLLKFLSSPEMGFKNYWFESGGRARVLLEFFKTRELASPLYFGSEKCLSLENLSNASGLDDLKDLTLLTQAGYFTIERVEGKTVYLRYPNKEVAQSMASLYTEMLLKGKTLEQAGAGNITGKMASEPLEEIVRLFSQLFESIDYQNYPVTNEAAFRALVQTYLTGAGLSPRVEVHGSQGRSDLEVRAGSRLWVFELKVARRGENAETLLREALEQIKSRRYGEQSETGELIRMALVFSIEKRQIAAWGCVG